MARLGLRAEMIALLALLTACPAEARSSRTYGTHSYHSPRHASSRAASGVARDAHGRIRRNESAKGSFEKETGYPHGRPGYVVDHVVPLARGGADDPSNMQWQTKAEAKAKDKVELGSSSTKHSRRRKD